MSDTISSADPDPIRRSVPSAGGELPTSPDPETVGGGPVSTPPPTPTPPDGAPEDPTPPDAPVGEAAGVADETLPDGVLPEVDGGLIETDVAMGGEDTVEANDLLDSGEVDRGD